MLNSSKFIALCLASLLPLACNESDSREVVEGVTALISSETGSSETVSTNLSDAINLLSDSNISSSSTSLALQGSPLDVEREKKCEADGDNAVVTISSSASGVSEYSTIRADISKEITGSSSVERVWSKESAAVECDDNNKRAAINWNADDISGLSLSVNVSRTKSSDTTRTKKSDESTMELSKSSSSKGTRTVEWASHTENGDDTFTRVKTVVSSMEHTKSISKDGEDLEMSFTVATEENAPLEISVTRNASTKDLVSQLISSGTLRSTESSGAYVLTSFSNYSLEFTDDECTPVSGSLTSVFYEEGSEDPIKTLELVVADGEYTLTDTTDSSNPEVVEDFDYDLCDVQDFM